MDSAAVLLVGGRAVVRAEGRRDGVAIGALVVAAMRSTLPPLHNAMGIHWYLTSEQTNLGDRRTEHTVHARWLVNSISKMYILHLSYTCPQRQSHNVSL